MRSFAVALLASCGSETSDAPGDTAEACDTMAVYSVNVTVADNGGTRLDDATATYSVDGAAAADCESFGNGEFGCGVELAGSFEVTASADGHEAETLSTTVSQGECHVEPAALAFTLDEACTSPRAVAMLVTLTASSGEELVNPAVESRSENSDTAPRTACDLANGKWYCNWEDWGSFTVYGIADGWAEAEISVEVPVDESGCQPVPQQVSLELTTPTE